MNITICWTCKRALPKRGCSWCDSFKPVKGWDAKPTLHSDAGVKICSYCVKNCPLYIPDGKRAEIPVVHNVFKHTFTDGRYILQIYNGALSDAKYAPEMRPFMKRWDKIKHEVIATDLKYHDAVELVKNIS